MAAPAGFVETSSGYPIIDPDTINPQADWPNGQQAQADWLDTHVIHTFPSFSALQIARPTMPPGQSGFALLRDTKTLWQWTGSAWEPAVPWQQTGLSSIPAIAAGGSLSGDLKITFPTAFPSAGYAPSLITSFQAARCTLTIVSRTATGMQVRVNNFTTAASESATVYWTATFK